MFVTSPELRVPWVWKTRKLSQRGEYTSVVSVSELNEPHDDDDHCMSDRQSSTCILHRAAYISKIALPFGPDYTQGISRSDPEQAKNQDCTCIRHMRMCKPKDRVVSDGEANRSLVLKIAIINGHFRTVSTLLELSSYRVAASMFYSERSISATTP